MAKRTLLLAHSCLRNTDFRVRASIARAAGFNSIGLNAGSISNQNGEYQRLRNDGWTDKTLHGVLLDFDIQIAELEALVIGNDVQADEFVRLAQLFGVQTIQTIAWRSGVSASDPLDFAHAVSWLRSVADRIADLGCRIALEFIPTTPIPDADTAQRLADEVDRINVGTCVDFWHVMRGRGISEMTRVDWNRVFNVQVNDGSLAPIDSDYIRDCLINRVVPGDGEFPIDKLMKFVPQSAPINMEVMNSRLDSGSSDDRQKILTRGLQRVLDAH
jgi:sugar phosphate isomerase/epimerase